MKAAGKCALDPGANRKPQQAAEQEGEARQKTLFSRINWAPYLGWLGAKRHWVQGPRVITSRIELENKEEEKLGR